MIRPCDANETAVAWRVALQARDRPVLLVLTRQDVAVLDRGRYAPADGLRRGAYVLADAPNGRPELILVASGSEVALIGRGRTAKAEGVSVRCVSMPSWDLFAALPQGERDAVLPPSVGARLAVEAGVAQGWHRYVGDQGDMLSVETFGASAPGNEILENYGFTVDNVCARARRVLGRVAGGRFGESA